MRDGWTEQQRDHAIYVVPKGEFIKFAKCFAGRWAAVAFVRWSSFGIGVELLSQGIGVQIGPAFLCIAYRPEPQP